MGLRDQIDSVPYPKDFYAPKTFSASTGLHPGLWAFPIVGNLADAWSTQFRIHRGDREANFFMAPLTKNPALWYVTKTGVGLFSALLANRLAKTGRKRAAKVVAIIGGAAPLAAAAYNLRPR